MHNLSPPVLNYDLGKRQNWSSKSQNGDRSDEIASQIEHKYYHNNKYHTNLVLEAKHYPSYQLPTNKAYYQINNKNNIHTKPYQMSSSQQAGGLRKKQSWETKDIGSQQMSKSNEQYANNKNLLQNYIQPPIKSKMHTKLGLGLFSTKKQVRQKSHNHRTRHDQQNEELTNIEKIKSNEINSNHNLPPKHSDYKISIRPRHNSTQKITFVSGKQKTTFEIIKELGKGMFGQVYLVQEAKTKMIFAMKVMSKEIIKKDPKTQSNIFRQLKIQKYINHPNIIKLYKQFQDSNNIYLIMQYMLESLFDHQKIHGCFSQGKTSRIIQQLCKAVKYLHSEDVLHRDLKLQNIMITHKMVKIGDFGCAIHTMDMRNTRIGSPAYFSQEQLKDSFYYKEVDIWSIGIITYELIFGQTPYDRDINRIINLEGPDKKDSEKKQLSDLKFPRYINISEEAKDFILQLLEKDPLKRMSLQKALIHPFIVNNRKNEVPFQ